MNENTRLGLIAGIVVGIIITVSILFILKKDATPPLEGDGIYGDYKEKEEVKNPNALPTVEGGTREKILQDVETPEAGTASTEDVAVPRYTTPAGKKGEASFRVFNIEAKNNVFAPQTIVVNENDLLKLEVRAEDADYDVFFPDFGVYKKLPKGALVTLQFQAAPFGTYSFFCKDACEKEMKGTLIVNEK